MSKDKRHFPKFFAKSISFVVGIFLIYALSKNIVDYQKKITFFEKYKQELATEQEKNKQLKSGIAASKDYYSVEANIRQKLDLFKPDEIAVIIPRPTPSPHPTPQPQRPPSQLWWQLFSHGNL